MITYQCPSNSPLEPVSIMLSQNYLLLSMNMPDPDHSEGEQRFIVLGMSDRYRLLVVSYTERLPRTRIISARLATRHEREQYEEE
jgi:uncharacterized DUF497 family protein